MKSRSYELPGTDEVFTLKKQIYQSAEYKQKAWSLFALGEVNEGYHRNIVFYTNGDGYNGVGRLSDSQKAQEIIDTLKAETLTHTVMPCRCCAWNSRSRITTIITARVPYA